MALSSQAIYHQRRVFQTQQSATSGFDVESQGFHCTDGTRSCNPGDPSQVIYSGASAVHIGPQTSARPTYIVVVCGKGYRDASGAPHILSEHVYAGAPGAGGTPGGFATLGPNPTETNPNASATMVVNGYDPSNRASGSAGGSMSFNNVTDTPNSGGFNISITGTLTDQNLGTGKTTSLQGKISCTTKNFAVTTPDNVNEAEMEDPADDD